MAQCARLPVRTQHPSQSRVNLPTTVAYCCVVCPFCRRIAFTLLTVPNHFHPKDGKHIGNGSCTLSHSWRCFGGGCFICVPPHHTFLGGKYIENKEYLSVWANHGSLKLRHKKAAKQQMTTKTTQKRQLHINSFRSSPEMNISLLERTRNNLPSPGSNFGHATIFWRILMRFWGHYGSKNYGTA